MKVRSTAHRCAVLDPGGRRVSVSIVAEDDETTGFNVDIVEDDEGDVGLVIVGGDDSPAIFADGTKGFWLALDDEQLAALRDRATEVLAERAARKAIVVDPHAKSN